MVESPDFVDPAHGIPAFSLLRHGAPPDAGDGSGDSRIVPSLVDLQDLGCRVQLHLHHDAAPRARGSSAPHGQERAGTDRPNPVGRGGRRSHRVAGWESLSAPVPAHAPRRLTDGERSKRAGSSIRWRLNVVDCRQIVTPQGWQPPQRARLRLATRGAHLGELRVRMRRNLRGWRAVGSGASHRSRARDAVRRSRHLTSPTGVCFGASIWTRARCLRRRCSRCSAAWNG